MQFNLYISNTYEDAFECILKQVKLKHNNKNKQFIIVPDRVTMLAERRLFDELGIESTFSTEVITLSKLANKVLTNLQNKNVLTKQSGIMLVTKLLINNTSKLKAFKKAARLSGFSEQLFETINQLKSSNITPEELKNSYDGTDTALKLKIYDISLIYDEYEKFLQKDFIDSSTKLNLLKEQIANSDLIKNSNFYFTLFDSFTSQQYQIIDRLVKYSGSVNIGFVSNTKQTNAQVYINDMYATLTNIARLHGMNLRDIIVNSRAGLKPEFNFMTNNLFAITPGKLNLNKAVELFEATTQDEEVDFVASKIMHKVMSGKRFKNISVAVSDLEVYEPIIKKVFSSYNIPYFIDASTPLNTHVLVKFLLGALAVVKNYFNYSDVIAYVKNYYSMAELNDTSLFEDFVLKYGIDKGAFLKQLKLGTKTKEQEAFERVKKEKLIPLIKLQNSFKTANTANEYVSILKDFIKEQSLEEKTANLTHEYAEAGNLVEQKITAQVFDKLNKLFEEIENILNEQELSLKEFYIIFENGLKAINLSTIPVSVDSVFVGAISNNNFAKTDSLFVLGMVDSLVPQVKQDVGIILDDDIKSINTKEKLEPSIRQVNKRAKFNLFQLLVLPKQNLYLSYSQVDEEGKTQKPSQVLLEVKKLFYANDKELDFNNLQDYLTAKDNEGWLGAYYFNKQVATSKLIKDIRRLKDGVDIENHKATSTLYTFLESESSKEEINKLYDLFDYENKVEDIKSADRLFFLKNTASITEFETYFKCPFMHFVKYGLKLQEKERAGIKALDVGNILHKVAEEFGKILIKNTPKRVELESIATDIIENILNKDKYLFIKSDSKNKNLSDSLRDEAIRLVEAIYYQNEQSDFSISALEKVYGKDNSETIKLKLGDKTIGFTGVIDRVDEFDDFARVVDYKTGSDKFNFTDLYYGRKIQLLIYASVARVLTNKKVAGAFYLPVKNNFEELKAAGNFASYKLDGALLNDYRAIKAMDKQLDASYMSNIVNVKTKKDGSLDAGSVKRTLTDGEFKALEDYALKISTLAGMQIIAGNIEPSPLTDSSGRGPCEYCKYKAICKFSEDFKNKKRKMPTSISKTEVEEAIKDE